MNRSDLPAGSAALRSAIAALLGDQVDIAARDVGTDHIFGHAFDCLYAL